MFFLPEILMEGKRYERERQTETDRMTKRDRKAKRETERDQRDSSGTKCSIFLLCILMEVQVQHMQMMSNTPTFFKAVIFNTQLHFRTT